MKKTNTSVTKITVLFIFLLVLVVGYYAYLSGTHRTEQQEAVMSEVDTALSRDLDNDYPATPKEVIKYYNDLMKCFYNEECTAEELQDLGRKSLQLFDEELQENNDEDTYLIRLQGEVQNYKDNKRKITSVSLATQHKCGLLFGRRIFFCKNFLWIYHDGKRQKNFYRYGISLTQG